MTEARYTVRVRGSRRDAVAAASREELQVTIEPVRTVLRGRVADQAALLEILAALRAHGVELLELRWHPDEVSSSRRATRSADSWAACAVRAASAMSRTGHRPQA
jgi:hypothetical protein